MEDKEKMEAELEKRSQEASKHDKKIALDTLKQLEDHDCVGKDCKMTNTKNKIETEAFIMGYLARDQLG